MGIAIIDGTTGVNLPDLRVGHILKGVISEIPGGSNPCFSGNPGIDFNIFHFSRGHTISATIYIYIVSNGGIIEALRCCTSTTKNKTSSFS